MLSGMGRLQCSAKRRGVWLELRGSNSKLLPRRLRWDQAVALSGQVGKPNGRHSHQFNPVTSGHSRNMYFHDEMLSNCTKVGSEGAVAFVFIFDRASIRVLFILMLEHVVKIIEFQQLSDRVEIVAHQGIWFRGD